MSKLYISAQVFNGNVTWFRVCSISQSELISVARDLNGACFRRHFVRGKVRNNPRKIFVTIMYRNAKEVQCIFWDSEMSFFPYICPMHGIRSSLTLSTTVAATHHSREVGPHNLILISFLYMCVVIIMLGKIFVFVASFGEKKYLRQKCLSTLVLLTQIGWPYFNMAADVICM